MNANVDVTLGVLDTKLRDRCWVRTTTDQMKSKSSHTGGKGRPKKSTPFDWHEGIVQMISNFRGRKKCRLKISSLYQS